MFQPVLQPVLILFGNWSLASPAIRELILQMAAANSLWKASLNRTSRQAFNNHLLVLREVFGFVNHAPNPMLTIPLEFRPSARDSHEELVRLIYRAKVTCW